MNNYSKTTVVGFLFLSICVRLGISFSQEFSPEEDYQQQWLKTEKAYTQEYLSKLKEEERKKDIQLFLEGGKDCLVKRQYPAALVYFRKIVELEKGLLDKEYTTEAEKFIRQIEEVIQTEIVEELDTKLKQDWARRKRGLSKIVERIPPGYFEKMAGEDKKERRQQRKVEERKRIEELKKRRLVEQEFRRQIKGLLKKNKFSAVIEQCDLALAVDKDNQQAKWFKKITLAMIKKERAIAKRREKLQVERLERQERRQQQIQKERQQEKIWQEEKKRRQEERRRKREEKTKMRQERRKNFQIRSYLQKAKALFANNQFIKAIEKVKKILGLESDNPPAKALLLEIKSRLKQIDNSLPCDTVLSPK